MKAIRILQQIICFCYIGVMLTVTVAGVLSGATRDDIINVLGLISAVTALLEIGLTIAFFTVKSIKGD